MSLFSATVRQLINSQAWEWKADNKPRTIRERRQAHVKRLGLARTEKLREQIIDSVRKLQPCNSNQVAKAIKWQSTTRAGEKLKELADDGVLIRYKLQGNSFYYELARNYNQTNKG